MDSPTAHVYFAVRVEIGWSGERPLADVQIQQTVPLDVVKNADGASAPIAIRSESVS